MLSLSFVAAVALFSAAVVEGGGDHDHPDDNAGFLCSDLNVDVTDLTSCEEWCGPTMDSEWTYISEDGDFEEFHVDFLTAWECHCEPTATPAVEVARQAVDKEHKHCILPYELPTCKSMGLADCGINVTMTCGELCDSVGLGAGGSTGRRFLDHTTDNHFCAHHEEGDHERRILQEDHDHDHEEESITICYCNALEEAASSSTIACSDADLDHGHNSGAVTKAAQSSLIMVAAGSFIVGAITSFM
jgi:hypothetical protein